MGIVLVVIGGLVFLAGAVAHVVVRVKLKPQDPDLDEWYHEFEDQHPEVMRYDKWTRVTLLAAVVGMLLLFVGMVL